ncbi:MAG: efflux transporter periplasmic adaptor subunit, partial [Phycisphaerales bacterium]
MKLKTIIAVFIVAAVLLLVGGGLAFWKYSQIRAAMSAPPPPEPAQAAQIVSARLASWQPTVGLSGTVVAIQSVTLSNEVAGSVRQVLFESGSIVEAG